MDKEKENVIKLSNEIVKELEKLLSTGDWEKSLFLRTMAKRIGNIRDDAQELVEDLMEEEDENSPANDKNSYAARGGYTKVYISLYQADGGNLQVWQNMLKSLAKYSINRPIYANEEHVKAMIRSKSDAIRHAYVIIAIKADSIIKSEFQQTDNLGHPLLTLKEHSIETDNIISFVHANKKVYVFHENKLILKDIIT